MSISKITDTSQNSDQLYSSLSQNLKIIKNTLGNSNDLILREITVGKAEKYAFAIIYVDGLTDKISISESVIDKLMLDIEATHETETDKIIRCLRDSSLTVGDVNDIFQHCTIQF
ncbi:spore germination protein [Lysinibacillus sp. RC79]|uniref:spore germination protein n=1 Tax=Lysinibacillus sp. RC79 TaxID=3156296 RepID=UPI003510E9C7